MVHTFELSKMISRDTFNEIIRSLKLRYYRYYWFTTTYSDKGFAAIRLYKFKRKEVKTEVQEDNDFTHYYIISLSINTANMFSGYQDPHININIYHKQTELEKDSLNVTLIQIIIFLESKYKLKKANSIRLLVKLV